MVDTTKTYCESKASCATCCKAAQVCTQDMCGEGQERNDAAYCHDPEKCAGQCCRPVAEECQECPAGTIMTGSTCGASKTCPCCAALKTCADNVATACKDAGLVANPEVKYCSANGDCSGCCKTLQGVCISH
jgi:hypothetical protein